MTRADKMFRVQGRKKTGKKQYEVDCDKTFEEDFKQPT